MCIETLGKYPCAEGQGENICVPELLKKIVNGEKEGVGAVWGVGNGPVGGCACMEQMENVPRTGDVSQL